MKKSLSHFLKHSFFCKIVSPLVSSSIHDIFWFNSLFFNQIEIRRYFFRNEATLKLGKWRHGDEILLDSPDFYFSKSY